MELQSNLAFEVAKVRSLLYDLKYMPKEEGGKSATGRRYKIKDVGNKFSLRIALNLR